MPKRVRFTYRAVRKHLKKHHPACPEAIRDKVADRVVRRKWDCSIGKAVGISVQTYARHEMTDYDQLYLIPGLTQEEAKLIIRDEVLDIVSGWQTPAADPPKSEEG